MSKGPIMFDKATGKLGNMVLSINHGAQLARAYNSTNSSKGSGASYAQRYTRVRLTNLIAFYRVLDDYFKKAFQLKRRELSDYNAFISANMSFSPVYLTKEIFENGGCVIGPYSISRGSLTEVNCSFIEGQAITDISLAGDDTFIGPTTTIQQLSRALIAGNKHLRHGDMLTFVKFDERERTIISESGQILVPTLETSFVQFTLNSANTDAIPSDVLELLSGESMQTDALALNFSGAGIACTISRRASGSLLVSPTIVALGSVSLYHNYTGSAALEAACISYGYEGAELLSPATTASENTSAAVISSVTYGTEEVSNGGSYVVGNTLKISGTNLSSSAVTVWWSDGNNHANYIATSASSAEMTFTLTAAGTIVIYLNGVTYYTFTMTGTTGITVSKVTFNGTSYSGIAQGVKAAASTSQTGVVDLSFAAAQSTAPTYAVTGATLTSYAWNWLDDSKKSGEATFVLKLPSSGNFTLTIAGQVVIAGYVYTPSSSDDDELV